MPTYEKLRGRLEALVEHYERRLVAKPDEKIDPTDVLSQLRTVLTPAAPDDNMHPRG